MVLVCVSMKVYILVWGVRYDVVGVCQYEGINISMGCEI